MVHVPHIEITGSCHVLAAVTGVNFGSRVYRNAVRGLVELVNVAKLH